MAPDVWQGATISKQPKRWRIWKIAGATAGCVAVAALVFWLSVLAEGVGGEQTMDPLRRAPALTLSTFIMMMLAIAAASLSVLGLIWLAFRIREARRPAWERRGRKKRR